MAGGQLSEIGARCPGFLPLAFVIQSWRRARHLKVWTHWTHIIHFICYTTGMENSVLGLALQSRLSAWEASLPCPFHWSMGKQHHQGVDPMCRVSLGTWDLGPSSVFILVPPYSFRKSHHWVYGVSSLEVLCWHRLWWSLVPGGKTEEVCEWRNQQ